jgi:outer membrane protein OmpA-like peptidoglycan-associated protein
MRLRNSAALVIGGAVMMIAGCAPMGPPPPPPIAPIAGPVVPAYMNADVIGGHAARVKKARAAGAKLLAAGAVWDYTNRQEAELRRQTAGTGVEVIRSGEVLMLRLPASGTFDVGQSAIRPQAVSTVNEIGLILKRFNQSLVDVLGHTDATGTAKANEALSLRRAQAVAAQLRTRGVSPARLATRGYGAAYPIADNGTEVGRATNRRVEIRLVPLR